MPHIAHRLDLNLICSRIHCSTGNTFLEILQQINSAFNALPWKEQREMLMKFVGNFTDAQIAEECKEKFTKLIPELKIASTDDILKKYTKAKNILNKDMVEIPARIDEVGLG